jgi:hypothetical protein
MRKLVDVVRLDEAPGNGHGGAGSAVLDRLGPALVAEESLAGLVIDVVRPEDPLRLSRRVWPELDAFHAVVSRWLDRDPAADGRWPRIAVPGTSVVWTFGVVEHVGVERTGDGPGTPLGAATSGLKHLSLLCPTVPGPEFRAAYRHHVELVHEHLPLVWRYVQNDIDASDGVRGGEFAAISELSYRSDAHYALRWARGAASEAEFRSHEGFLDLRKTITAICTEHVLRTPPGWP